jgi:glycosyltransferase involved in cell wall biosynthesis
VTGADVTQHRPRVLFVGRTRYRLPLADWLAKKFDALERQLDYRVVASAHQDDQPLADERFRLLPPAWPLPLDGILFYLRSPFAVRRQILEFRPDVIVAESPYTGIAAMLGRALVSGRRPRIVVEVHGDWRTATRLYGSPRRRVLSPFADWVSRVALRHGDAVRALSPFTAGLVEEVRGIPVTSSFPTYTDLSAFTERPVQPLPERPTAIFVGMLEAYKNVDDLAAAWRTVVERRPEALLIVVGDGARRHVIDRLVADLPGNVEHFAQLDPREVAAVVDRSTVLVLSSKAEGLGRVIIEALARGRGVIAARGGGVVDIVRDGAEGLLIEPGNRDELAEALVRVLSDGALARRLGAAARERYADWHTTPAEYAARVRGLVETTLREPGVERPRVLIVSRGEGQPALAALREELEPRILAPQTTGRFFRLLLPFRVASAARRFRPQVVIAETPHLGFLVLLGLSFRRRDRPALVVETYGDWRLAVRLSGSRARLLVAPLADWAARFALRRADALRAVSPFTAGLAERAAGVPPVESFPGYIDLHAFLRRAVQPLPPTPSALFVGMLERSKDLETLAEAWRLVAAAVPEARLVVIGRGALVDVVERLRDDYPERIEYVPEVAPSEVASRLDESTFLVLPSRSEGLGRVIIEAFTRGRPVIATRVGGIPDIVRDHESGLLVEQGDAQALADAMVAVLTDRELAERLAQGAREAAEAVRWTPDDYAARVRGLVDRTLAAAGR